MVTGSALTGAGFFHMKTARAQAGGSRSTSCTSTTCTRASNRSKPFRFHLLGLRRDRRQLFLAGVGRLATKIWERRSQLEDEGANVITLDAGDQCHGFALLHDLQGRGRGRVQ